MSTAVAAKQVDAKPIVKKQLGNTSIAVFARKVSRSDGTKYTARDVVLQKSRKDALGNWQGQTIYLKARDILTVHKTPDQAFVESYESQNDEEE